MSKKVSCSKEYMLLCGERLKECREAAGYTQEELINKIMLLPENRGKERNEKHISSVENGRRPLSIEYARLISKVLNVREDYLLGKDNFKTGSEESASYTKEWSERRSCIKFLIQSMGYAEEYASQLRYRQLFVSSADTNETIEKKITFAKKGLSVYPEWDMIISDEKGRRIHLMSNEIERIYDDIESFIKYRLEREFDDITRYACEKDMGDNGFSNTI